MASSARVRYLLPLGAFVLVGIALGIGLTLRPDIIPSALIDKPVPEFDLPPIAGRDAGFATSDLKGKVSLVNVFASWCIPCRAEHPILTRLAETGGVPVYGINYKDKPADVRRWLDQLGDPYTRIGADLDGRVAIDWGVYGIPETFIIDRNGRIAYKQIGPMSPRDVEETIMPIIDRLRK